MKKNVMIGLLIGAMTLSLAACGSTETTESSAESMGSTAFEETIAATEAVSEEQTAAAETTEAEAEVTASDIEVVLRDDSFAETGLGTFEDTWTTIQDFGFGESGYSTLEYYLDGMTLYEEDDYYVIGVTLYRGVRVPAGLQVGDTIELETDSLAHKGGVYTCTAEGVIVDEQGAEYTLFATTESDSYLYAYGDSDLLLTTPFYNGTLHISKDAEIGSYLADDITTFDMSSIPADSAMSFDGVAFDENGLVTGLINLRS